MPQRSRYATEEQWKRLADAINRRLGEVGLTIEEVAVKPWPSRSIWSIATRAAQANGTMAYDSLMGISRRLGWTAQSATEVLDGGTPTVTPEGKRMRKRTDQERLADLEDTVSRLEAWARGEDVPEFDSERAGAREREVLRQEGAVEAESRLGSA